MRIISGDLSKHRVRQVIFTAQDLPAPGWTRYAEIHSPGLIHLREDGTEELLLEVVLWRAGASATLPAGATPIPKGNTYPRRPEAILQPQDVAGQTWLGGHEVSVTEAGVRRLRGDLRAAFPYLWSSPRTLSYDQEAMALKAAGAPQSEVLRCSVRPENGRWIHTTGTGDHLRVWGACLTQEEAIYLAECRLHTAWLTWHNQILALAGGRTDWLDGLPAAEPCEILLLGRGEAKGLVGDVRAYNQVNATMRGGTQAALREIMHTTGLMRSQVAEVLQVSAATVDSWLRPSDNAAFRAMPVNQLELLRRKLLDQT